MASGPTPHDALADLVLRAPGRAAARSALGTLHRLAADGDVAAVARLSQLLALELGIHGATPVAPMSPSLADIAHNEDVAPLIRLYAAAYLPRELLSNSPTWAEAARKAQADDDLTAFQSLVRRNAPVCDEALKAYLVCAFVGMYSWDVIVGTKASGAKLGVLDQILGQARVVPGDSVDSGFEFGRDAILECSGSRALFRIIAHELGHHVLDAAVGGGVPAPLSAGPDVVREIADVLPGMLQAAAAAIGVPPAPGDPRVQRLPGGLSIMCSVERLPGGSYTHFSLTAAGGPIELVTALPLARCVVGLVGGAPARVAAALSPRGVFHFGVEGEPPPSAQIRAQAGRLDTADWGAIAEEARTWFAGLDAAGRVGTKEADVRYILGVAERPAIVYGLDPESAWGDHAACAQVRDAPSLEEVPEPVLAELLRVTVRCADPVGLTRVLAAGARPERIEGLDPVPAQLGTSLCAIRDGDQLGYRGPDVPGAFAVLDALSQAGFGLNGTVTEDGQTLLTDAAGRSSWIVSRLLAAGVDVDLPNVEGWTPLMVAARADVGSALLLLDAGASVVAADADGFTPLHHAAAAAHDDLVALLLARGADPEARSGSGCTALMMACSDAAVGRLCEAGADPNASDTAGSTALMAAAGRGDVDVVRRLLLLGADAAATTDRGHSALHIAGQVPASAGGVELIDLLVGAGAGLDEETDDGITPLMAAVRVANDDAVAHLVGLGADVTVRSVHGNTALLFASDGEKEWNRNPTTVDRMERCIQVLADAGADVNAANDNAETPLLWATRGFHSGPVELLLALGADPQSRSLGGATPLGNARRQDHGKMIADLLAAGAADGVDSVPAPRAGEPGDGPRDRR